MAARIKNAFAALLMLVCVWTMAIPASALNYTVEYEMTRRRTPRVATT